MTSRHWLMTLLMLGPTWLSALPGCSVCKSSDTYEQCRTKERDHSQPRVEQYLGKR